MDWPVAFPEMASGAISVRSYDRADAAELFDALADERVWTYMSRSAPSDAATLDGVITSALTDAYRVTFTVCSSGRAVGVTSVSFDPGDPEGVEIGGTLLDPRFWGTGVNAAVKKMLVAALFRGGARWVQLQTDERNERSAAAIRKLGVTDLGVRQEPFARRDGTLRRSRIFRIERPGPANPEP